jgi:hypothetical protein
MCVCAGPKAGGPVRDWANPGPSSAEGLALLARMGMGGRGCAGPHVTHRPPGRAAPGWSLQGWAASSWSGGLPSAGEHALAAAKQQTPNTKHQTPNTKHQTPNNSSGRQQGRRRRPVDGVLPCGGGLAPASRRAGGGWRRRGQERHPQVSVSSVASASSVSVPKSPLHRPPDSTRPTGPTPARTRLCRHVGSGPAGGSPGDGASTFFGLSVKQLPFSLLPLNK